MSVVSCVSPVYTLVGVGQLGPVGVRIGRVDQLVVSGIDDRLWVGIPEGCMVR